MSPDEVAELGTSGIFALPVFSVESLYYSRETRAAVAAQQADTLGCEAAELLRRAKTAALNALKRNGIKENLAGQVSARALRDEVLSKVPDKMALQAAGPSVSITVRSQYAAHLARLEALLLAGNVDGVIDSYNIRESGALDAIARELRFGEKTDYERAALVRVASDDALANALRLRLAPLTLALLWSQL